MRGKGPPRRSEFLHTRITPAYAGKSDSFYVKLLDTADHPRLCGEKLKYFDVYTDIKGSPPPMRGKVWVHHSSPRVIRITPAYAGKRHHFAANHRAFRDHPRLCGEKEGNICRHDSV